MIWDGNCRNGVQYSAGAVPVMIRSMARYVARNPAVQNCGLQAQLIWLQSILCISLIDKGLTS